MITGSVELKSAQSQHQRLHLRSQLPDLHQQRIDPRVLRREQREQLLTRHTLRLRHPKIKTRSRDRGLHLYEAGVPLPFIRDLLGHVELSTTEIYARASTEAKRRALEAAHTDIVTDDLPEWNQDPGLLNWLTNL